MQPLLRPLTGEFREFARGRQRFVRRGEMEIQPLRARVEGEAHDRVRDVINRHNVHAQVRVRGQNVCDSSKIQLEWKVKAVKSLDLAGARISDDHPGAQDRDRQLAFGGLNQALPFVFAELVGARKAKLFAERLLGHGAAPPPANVRRRDM